MCQGLLSIGSMCYAIVYKTRHFEEGRADESVFDPHVRSNVLHDVYALGV